MNNLDLNILVYKPFLKIEKKENTKVQVFDPIRKKPIIVTPEEMVRQLLIQYFLQEKNYPKNYFSVEKMLIINNLQKRFDILIYDKNTQPFLIVECKAPQIPVSDDVFRQAATYNFQLRAPYLVVCNGITTYCCKIDYENETYEFLEEIPDWY